MYINIYIIYIDIDKVIYSICRYSYVIHLYCHLSNQSTKAYRIVGIYWTVGEYDVYFLLWSQEVASLAAGVNMVMCMCSWCFRNGRTERNMSIPIKPLMGGGVFGAYLVKILHEKIPVSSIWTIFLFSGWWRHDWCWNPFPPDLRKHLGWLLWDVLSLFTEGHFLCRLALGNIQAWDSIQAFHDWHETIENVFIKKNKNKEYRLALKAIHNPIFTQVPTLPPHHYRCSHKC